MAERGLHLLRQPCGFEGFRGCPVLLDTADLSVADPHCPALIDVERYTAPCPSKMEAQNDDEHIAATQDLQHLGLHAVTPDLAETRQGSRQAIVTVNGLRGAKVAPRCELQIRRVELPCRFPAPAEYVDGSPRQLHVLLRHRLPSIPEGADA
ncbi:MAG: hypothetical protein QOK19_2609 [Solirubrobacteraceae bacterium]|nr:hypothetical protein [Solirubrobacteraceae bacterium]